MMKVEVNDTQVEVEESEKCIEVKITTESADVYVNGVCVWSKYDNPNYTLVPPALRKFIKEHDDGYMEQDKEKTSLTADIRLFSECISFYFPLNLEKPITARFDCINNIKELEEEYIRNTVSIKDKNADELTAKIKKSWADLELFISEKTKFKFRFSHSMNDRFFGYWDIVFNLKDWNEDLFKEVAQQIHTFNELVGGIANKYHF